MSKERLKIWILSGIQGSGKSTEAKKIFKENKNTYRVNRDALRQCLYMDDFSPRHEHVVTEMSDMMVKALLNYKCNVIVDNMNLTEKDTNWYKELAKHYEADIQFIKMDTPIEECIRRDAERGKAGQRAVGKNVILNTAWRHGIHRSTNKCVVVDMDGTLADCMHRVHYVRNLNDDPNFKKNWFMFNKEMANDTLRLDVLNKVLEVIKSQGEPVDFIICSAREDTFRKETEEWLDRHFIPYDRLIMRRGGDSRDDAIIKRELLDNMLDKGKIVKVFDDRPKVIRMWRENGLDVEDVGGGVEF